MKLDAYESPIHELSYAVLLVSGILQIFYEIWRIMMTIAVFPQESLSDPC